MRLTWLDRAFATLYDPVMAGSEVRGLSRWRASLLSDLQGDVLEIGAGTGLNLAHYPVDAQVVLTEPNPEMREKLVDRVESRDHPWEVVDAAAESLPFEDARFDAVVSGLVLCSVTDPQRCLAEIFRVLRPGGRFAYIEHVGSDHSVVHGVQRAIEPLWKVAARGCHLTRDTESLIRDAGFLLPEVDPSPLPGGFVLVAPAIHGIAVRP